jgi:hypothetical protein
MPQFEPGRRFQRDLNVRRFDYLLHLLEARDALPNGVLWPLVATRRAGKTWALKALEDHLGKARARYLDPTVDKKFPPRQSVACLLVDEPASVLQPDAAPFIAACARLKESGTKILVAMSPGEWEQLRLADPDGCRINRDDLRYLEPLRDAEMADMTRRAAWAGGLAQQLDEPWRRHPFLLELALAVAERNAGLRGNLPELLRTAVDETSQSRHRYVERAFYAGFSDGQRDLVRRAARRQTIRDGGETVEVLCGCHVLEKAGQEYVLLDPILADHLPPPLRIHHVSDCTSDRRRPRRSTSKPRGRTARSWERGPGTNRSALPTSTTSTHCRRTGSRTL